MGTKRKIRNRLTRKRLAGGSGKTIDLVVARYKESLEWLKSYKDRGFHTMYIYNKSDKDIKCPNFQNTATHCKVRNIPNVGVCDHSYLYHIVHNYNTLADVTIFTPGSADYKHKSGILKFTIDKTFETKDTVMNAYEFDIDVAEAMYTFTMHSYPTSYDDNRDGAIGEMPQKLSDIRPFGAWYKANFPGVHTNKATFFGMMAISREHIHRRPKSFYQGLMKQLGTHKFHESSHFMERSYIAMVYPIPDRCIYTDNPIFHEKIGIDQRGYKHARRVKPTRTLKPLQRGGGSIFAVLAMFKNEAMAIREWVDHYKWMGADLILLLDNNSDDGGADLVKGVEGVTVIPYTVANSQEKGYNDIGLPWLRKNNVDILIIVDLDEFVFSTDGRRLKDVATEFFSAEGAPSMCTCMWTMFGARGGEGKDTDIFDKQPESIRKSFVWRKTPLDINTKAIMRMKDVKDGGLHLHQSSVNGGSTGCPSNIQLNHYAIQSKEFFEKVKMKRGDATSSTMNNVRTWDYFNRYDFHDQKETTLKDLVEKAGH
jgi:hypothetical protein